MPAVQWALLRGVLHRGALKGLPKATRGVDEFSPPFFFLPQSCWGLLYCSVFGFSTHNISFRLPVLFFQTVCSRRCLLKLRSSHVCSLHLQVYPLRNAKKNLACSHHPEENVLFYCAQDRCLVCTQCLLSGEFVLAM